MMHKKNLVKNRKSEKKKKSNFFEKQSNLMQKLLKAECFINEMHEYEIKSFLKTL